MFERVILRATEGELQGQTFELENDSNYTLGRSKDCSPRLPATFYMVSRHHCLIKISAPLVHIQDLGSLNGTYVNHVKIGQRDTEQSFEEARQAEHMEYLLQDGDELRIGPHAFRVEFVPSPPCVDTEFRAPDRLWRGGCVACL